MTQIARQGHAHAHRKYTGFFQRTRAKGGHIAAGKNTRVALALKKGINAHAAIGIERQTGGFQPTAAGRLRDPEHRIGVHLFQCRCHGTQQLHTGGADSLHPRTRMHLHAARLQGLHKARPHACAVRGQDLRRSRKQSKLRRWQA